MRGTMLIERLEMTESGIDRHLNGLADQGYILSNKVNLMKIEDVERAIFRVNAALGRDLRDAIRGRKKPEERTRRRRG